MIVVHGTDESFTNFQLSFMAFIEDCRIFANTPCDCGNCSKESNEKSAAKINERLDNLVERFKSIMIPDTYEFFGLTAEELDKLNVGGNREHFIEVGEAEILALHNEVSFLMINLLEAEVMPFFIGVTNIIASMSIKSHSRGVLISGFWLPRFEIIAVSSDIPVSNFREHVGEVIKN